MTHSHKRAFAPDTIGFAGGVARRWTGGNLGAFDHVLQIERAESNAPSSASNRDDGQLRLAVGCETTMSRCQLVRSTNLVVARDPLGPRAIAIIVDSDSCRHATRLRFHQSESIGSWDDPLPRFSLGDLASITSTCVLQAETIDWEHLPSAILEDELHLRLSSSLQSTRQLTETIDSLSETGSIDAKRPIAQAAIRRARLGALEEFGIAARISGEDLSVIRSEIGRADATIQVVTAMQLYRLVENTAELAERVRSADSALAKREQAWARWGAVTIAPLLFLSALGINAFPTEVFGEPMQAWVPFLLAIALACVVSAAGFLLTRQKRNGLNRGP